MMNSTYDSYWAEYDGLQKAKHQLLRHYLGGWFPILASWQGRVIYLDCHAGRGKHDTGHEGSPILALKILLDHSHRDRILNDTEVRFIFFEKDQTNFDLLCEEIKTMGVLPPNVVIDPYMSDFEKELRKIIDNLHMRNENLAPSLAFVDPFGFSLSMNLLNDLLEFQCCELLVNFMYRFVDMAIHQPSQEKIMDNLFGCKSWRDLSLIEDSEQRALDTINLFSNQLNTKYATFMYMKGANNLLKYALIHVTNHSRGREKMKEALWRVTPDGSFTAYEKDSPFQPALISVDPDLEPLKNDLWATFKGKKTQYSTIRNWLVDTLYLPKYLHQILRGYRNTGIIPATGYGEKFAFKNDPLFEFPNNRADVS